MTEQARRFGVEILQAQAVTALEEEQAYRVVRLSDGRPYHAKALLLATGASYRRLGVPGEDDLIGAGVHFCATCDGPFYRGTRRIVVVGGGNSACEEGLHRTRFAERVMLLVRGDRLTANQIAIDKIQEPSSRMDVRLHTVVEAFEAAGGKLKAVRVRDQATGRVETLAAAAAFVFIGQEPNTAIARDRVVLDRHGFVLTGHDLEHPAPAVGGAARRPGADRPRGAFETSWAGVFAAGDARHGSTKQVAAAVGEGAAAEIAIRDFLRQT